MRHWFTRPRPESFNLAWSYAEIFTHCAGQLVKVALILTAIVYISRHLPQITPHSLEAPEWARDN